MVWEDTSPEGVAWVEAEFQHLWDAGKPLPDAIIEEIGRCARKREVELGELGPIDVAAAALVEAPLYRRGEDLQALAACVCRPRDRAPRDLWQGPTPPCRRGRGRQDPVARRPAAMVAALLEDGPVLILCPATLCQQWQVELKDKLGIPSAVWLSSAQGLAGPQRAHHPDPRTGGHPALPLSDRHRLHRPDLPRQRGARTACSAHGYGTLVLDEAHRARRSQGIGSDGEPNRLLSFMFEAATQCETRLARYGDSDPDRCRRAVGRCSRS